MRFRFLAPLALVLTACVAHAQTDQLLGRAAFDLHCSESLLQLTQIDEMTIGVRGCNQQAVYVDSCDGPRDNMSTSCTWVMNGPAVAVP
jgi:hypothetical protein